MEPMNYVAILLLIVAVGVFVPDLIKWAKSKKVVASDKLTSYPIEPEITPYDAATAGQPEVIEEEEIFVCPYEKLRPARSVETCEEDRLQRLLELIDECDLVGAKGAASRLRGAAAILAKEDTLKGFVLELEDME